MTILIHGALQNSNFGDVLFGKLFYDYVYANKLGDVVFAEFPNVGIGDFARKELNYTKRVSFKQFFSTDVLIYMSGGYLGSNHKSFKKTIVILFRFLSIGIVMKLMRKPMVFCGVGGGPMFGNMNRKIATSLLNYASYVTVRNEKTKDYYVNYGVKNLIEVTTDTTLLIRPENLSSFGIEEYVHKAEIQSRKKILLHIPSNPDAVKLIQDNIIPALKKFVTDNPEYAIVVGADELYSRAREVYDDIDIHCKELYEYRRITEHIALLNSVDVVITPKLHVGVVSAALNKSVISFPFHLDKVERFYRQIGERDRVVPLSELSEEIVACQIKKYIDRPIHISEDLRSKALENLKIIDKVVQKIRQSND